MVNERKRKKDHERYMKHREERLQKQREYYQTHKEYFVSYRHKRIAKEKEKLMSRPQGCYDCLYRDNCKNDKNKENKGYNCPDWEWRYY